MSFLKLEFFLVLCGVFCLVVASAEIWESKAVAQIGGIPIDQIPDGGPGIFGKVCVTSSARTCGSWPVAGPVCMPAGGTCVSGIVGDWCGSLSMAWSLSFRY